MTLKKAKEATRPALKPLNYKIFENRGLVYLVFIEWPSLHPIIAHIFLSKTVRPVIFGAVYVNCIPYY